MATNTDTDKCGGSFEDADKTFVCDRAGRHVVHQDADGTKAVKAPGGFLVSKPNQK